MSETSTEQKPARRFWPTPNAMDAHISPAMVAQLRSKPGGDEIAVTLGDFSEVTVAGTYPLIYVVWNSFCNLLSQDEQVRCFENVAAHLADGGSFVIEAGSPDFLYRLQNDQYVEAESIEVGEVRLDVLKHDPGKQMIDENHVTLSSKGIRMNPVVQRYAWPRTRPDGADRRAALDGTLGRLEPKAVHRHGQYRRVRLRTLS